MDEVLECKRGVRYFIGPLLFCGPRKGLSNYINVVIDGSYHQLGVASQPQLIRTLAQAACVSAKWVICASQCLLLTPETVVERQRYTRINFCFAFVQC